MIPARLRAAKRDVDGIVLLDKPEGLSATQALGRVKWLLGARKGGHTGALDPLATGLLPLCFGHATKVSGLLLEADKRYVCVARLGVVTDTADLDGQILATHPVPELDDAAIERAAAGFRGSIMQVPPMVSALKHQGQRLYALARKGVVVEREARRVTVHALRVERLDRERLSLDIHCSKGTYVRSLVHDLGEVLGCGAAVESLRRTRHGPFRVDDAVSLAAIEALYAEASGQSPEALDADGMARGRAALDALLWSADRALDHLPAVDLDGVRARYFCAGNPVFVAKPGDLGPRRVYRGALFLGVGEIIDDGRLAPRRRFIDAAALDAASSRG